VSAFVVHFPDGTREFRYPPKPLEDGDVIWHEGQRYRVIHVATNDGNMSSITVELDSEDIGDLLGSERGGLVLVPAD
jgi:hypothetical protein